MTKNKFSQVTTYSIQTRSHNSDEKNARQNDNSSTLETKQQVLNVRPQTVATYNKTQTPQATKPQTALIPSATQTNPKSTRSEQFKFTTLVSEARQQNSTLKHTEETKTKPTSNDLHDRNSAQSSMVAYPQDSLKAESELFAQMFYLGVYQNKDKYLRDSRLSITPDTHRTVLSHICPPFAIGLNRAIDYTVSLLSNCPTSTLIAIKQEISNGHRAIKEINFINGIINLAIDKLLHPQLPTSTTQLKHRKGYHHITILSPKTLEDMINLSEKILDLSKRFATVADKWYLDNYNQLANLYLEILFQLHNNNLTFTSNPGQELTARYLDGRMKLNYNAAGNSSHAVILKIFEEQAHAIQQDLQALTAKNIDIIGIINSWNATYKFSLEQIEYFQDFKAEEFRRNVLASTEEQTADHASSIQITLRTCIAKIAHFGVDGRNHQKENFATDQTPVNKQEEHTYQESKQQPLTVRSNNTPLGQRNMNQSKGVFITHVTNERNLPANQKQKGL